MTEHFIIPGAQRAGTTLLIHLLDQHPEIEIARPWRPEPKYFLDAAVADHGYAGYRTRFPVTTATARMVGEKSTSYLETAGVPERIAAVLPGAKILIVLRDPIARAVSNYRFSCANGLEAAPIGEAFYDEESRSSRLDWRGVSVCPFFYLKRGRYVDYLPRWERDFPAAQRLIVLFEELIQSPSVLATVFRFLGVDPLFQATFPVTPLDGAAGGMPLLDADLRRYLADYFAEPNRTLAARYQLDLSCWTSTTRLMQTSPRGLRPSARC